MGVLIVYTCNWASFSSLNGPFFLQLNGKQLHTYMAVLRPSLSDSAVT